MVISIRECMESDLDTVASIQRAAYKPLFDRYQDADTNPYMESNETIRKKYTREGTTGYLILKDDIPVGTVRITIFPEYRSAKVSALGVLPQEQGQGIAQKAMLLIEQQNSKIRKWFLDTIMQEEGNCHLYEKLGYRRTGKTETINERMTLVYYEKLAESTRE